MAAEETNYFHGPLPILLAPLKHHTTPDYLLPRRYFMNPTAETFKRKHMTSYWLVLESQLFSRSVTDIFCSEHETMFKFLNTCEEILERATPFDRPWIQMYIDEVIGWKSAKNFLGQKTNRRPQLMNLLGMDSDKNSSFSRFSQATKFRLLYMFMTMPQLYGSVTPRPSLRFPLRMRHNAYQINADSSHKMMTAHVFVQRELLKFPHYHAPTSDIIDAEQSTMPPVLVRGIQDEPESEDESEEKEHFSDTDENNDKD